MPTLTTEIVPSHSLPAGIPVLVGARQADIDVLLEIGYKPRRLQTTVLRYSSSDRMRNWYWGIVQVVADGIGVHKNDLHANLKYKAGLIKSYLLGDTGPVVELKSIARTSIEDPELRMYINLAVDIIFQRYLPTDVRAEVYRRTEDKYGPRPADLLD